MRIVQPVIVSLIFSFSSLYATNDIHYSKNKMDRDTLPESSFSSKKSVNEIIVAPLFNESGFSLAYSYLYRQSDLVIYGGGVDWTKYSIGNPYNIMAFYGKYKVYKSMGFAKVYGSARIGYGLPTSTEEELETDFSGGPMGAVTAGIRLGKAPPFLEVGLGLRYQSASFDRQNSNVVVEETINFKRVEIAFGITF